MDSPVARFFNVVRRWAFGVAALALVIAGFGCDTDAEWMDKLPSRMGYHYEPVQIRVHPTNWDRETTGVQSAVITAFTLKYGGWLEGFSREASFLLRRFDTTTIVCTTSARHLVPYQLRYGGDTTRLSVLTSSDEWSCWICFYGDSGTLDSGETLELGGADLDNVPDTVRAGAPIVWDIEFDMSGLLTVDRVRYIPMFRLHADHIICRQLP